MTIKEKLKSNFICKMKEYIISRRKDDAIISVYQDNNAKTVEISGLNTIASSLLGYEESDLIYKPLAKILSPNIIEDIESYLEYFDGGEDGNDLYDVLSKVRNFRLIKSDRELINVKIKVFRVAQNLLNRINYELLVRDISLSHKLNLFRESKNVKYTIHPELDILDERSTKLEIDLILEFINKNNIDAIILSVNLDQSNSDLYTSLIMIIRAIDYNIRSDDMIGYLGDGKVIVVLINCKLEYASSVVLRLHSIINQSLKSNSSSGEMQTVSIGYSFMLGEKKTSHLLNRIIFEEEKRIGKNQVNRF